MNVIAHRGFWLEPNEKNSTIAFKRALAHGFGIETDFRDLNGTLVISHDLPTTSCMTATELASLIRLQPVISPHALNIKSDGLHMLMEEFLAKANCSSSDYFVFDMSVPDTRGYLSKEIRVFSRLSEYETNPSFINQSAGIWLDAFESDWYDMQTLKNMLANGKQVSIVSPELHSRPHLFLWKAIRQSGLHTNSGISICTDFPLAASTYFNE
jgi:hypothetical protein